MTERRLLGLDRPLILPTVGVLFVVILWSRVMPAIDAAVANRVVVPGTVYDIGPASFAPVPGWVLTQAPSPVGESTSAAILAEGVTFRVQGGKWNATAAQLLERVARDQEEFIVEGPVVPVRSAQGVSGVARRIHGPDYVGLLVAFVDDAGRGVSATVKGPVDTSEALAQPVAEMIRAIVFEAPQGG